MKKQTKLYREIDGDLIKMFQKGKFDIIAHGCNCYATMKAGIALTIGQQFPEAMTADKKMLIPNGPKRLGRLTYTEIDNLFEKGKSRPKYLFNLYTQHYPGPDFKFNALRKALREMKNIINYECYSGLENSKIRIGLPLIGCGIAGGDWKKVSKLIQKELAGFDVTIIHFKQIVEGVNYWKPKVKQRPDFKVSDDDDFEQLEDWTDKEIEQYFRDNHDTDISEMDDVELEAFLDSI